MAVAPCGKEMPALSNTARAVGGLAGWEFDAKSANGSVASAAAALVRKRKSAGARNTWDSNVELSSMGGTISTPPGVT